MSNNNNNEPIPVSDDSSEDLCKEDKGTTAEIINKAKKVKGTANFGKISQQNIYCCQQNRKVIIEDGCQIQAFFMVTDIMGDDDAAVEVFQLCRHGTEKKLGILLRFKKERLNDEKFCKEQVLEVIQNFDYNVLFLIGEEEMDKHYRLNSNGKWIEQLKEVFEDALDEREFEEVKGLWNQVKHNLKSAKKSLVAKDRDVMIAKEECVREDYEAILRNVAHSREWGKIVGRCLLLVRNGEFKTESEHLADLKEIVEKSKKELTQVLCNVYVKVTGGSIKYHLKGDSDEIAYVLLAYLDGAFDELNIEKVTLTKDEAEMENSWHRLEEISYEPIVHKKLRSPVMFEVTPEKKKPLKIGDPIVDLFVITSVRIKMQGFLMVNEGEWVTLMACENLQPGYLWCRSVSDPTGEGRIPCTAVFLSQHCYNVYLDALQFVVKYPLRLLELLKTTEPSVMIDMLCAKNLLSDALTAILKQEWLENQRKNLEAETFRSETPAMVLISRILKVEDVRDFRNDFVKFIVENCVLYKKEWNSKVLGKVVSLAVEYLAKKITSFPAELVLILKAVRKVHPSFPEIFFFLRYICPALVMPAQYCGIEVSDKNVVECLKQMAKSLQMMANHAEPSEDSFAFPIATVLAYNSIVLANVFDEVTNQSCPPILVPRKPVIQEAMATYNKLCEMELEEFEKDDFAKIQAKLGPKVSAGTETTPQIEKLKEQLRPYIMQYEERSFDVKQKNTSFWKWKRKDVTEKVITKIPLK